MQYEALVREAWRLTWRFRSLWLLGLFTGGAAGASCSWTNSHASPRTTTVTPATASPEAEGIARALASRVAANIGLIVVVGLLVILLVLAGIVVSFIAQGGLTRAGADAARGGAPTLGQAWGTGLHLFWRYVGLWLLVAVAAIGIAIVVAIVIAIVVLIAGAGNGSPGRALIALVVGVPLAIAGLVLAIVAASTVTFAQRAIAIEELGPLGALRAGWLLFRAHAATSVVLWILNIVLAIAAGIAIAITVVIVAIPLVLVGVILWLALGLNAVVVAWGVLGGIMLLAAVVVVGAIAGTFFWHYWTLTYLRLSALPALAPATA